MVISWETGQVLDYEVLSKWCNTCERQKTKWGEDSDQFKEWMETHKENCSINHFGSSPAMECEGVLRIWRRSVATRHFVMVTRNPLQASIRRSLMGVVLWWRNRNVSATCRSE